ncbi:ABC transporter substrate-binding protein [Bacillus tianshenii]|uniref:ABC transporter substrate-binding protein n=1 Tax=Sutcliffiella tianshenii TaxID=1463404 RepID=UPI001CD5A275|nr:ABC transporter substrate-binding protein [Bacillus tianshenii]MCA1318352.1 ABC transporter substrate-binding protein [Bacillus tianshenii]
MLEHYVRLLDEHVAVDTPIAITIEELSNSLFCSKRYTKQIMKELKEQGLIAWEVKPGRGNRSILKLLLSVEDMELMKAQELFKQEKYKQSLEPLKNVSNEKREEFLHWMEGQLGYVNDREDKDILRYPFYEAVKNLDPIGLVSRHDVHIAEQIYDTLVSYKPMENVFEPRLAYAWEVDESGLIWIFYLRKGVYFHQGRKFEADDVVYTFERLLNMDTEETEWIKALVKMVEKISTYTVQFHLKTENYLFLNYLSGIRAAILPKDEKVDLRKMPVGTGPYKLVRNDESMMVLDVNERYFLGRPFLDRVEIIHVPDLSQKQTQLSFWLSKRNIKPETSIRRLEKGATFLSFNLRKNGHLQDEKWRDAIMAVLDPNKLIENIGAEHHVVATSFLPEKSGEFACGPSVEAHLPLKKPLVVCGTQIRKGANVERELIWVTSMLEEAGYQVKAEIVPIEELAKEEYLEGVDMVIGGIALSEDEVLSYVRFFQMSQAFIYNLADDELQKEINETIRLVEKTSVRSEQLQLLLDMEKRVIESKLIHLFYHRAQQVNIYNSSIQGVSLKNNGRVMYKDLWVKEGLGTG